MEQAHAQTTDGILPADDPGELGLRPDAHDCADMKSGTPQSSAQSQEQTDSLHEDHLITSTIRSPENYVLVDEIRATPPERHILATLGIRRNGAGALPALRTATRAAIAAAAHHGSERAQAWVKIFQGLVARVSEAAKQATWLETLCPVVFGRTVADGLGDPARCALNKDQRDRLDAWLGVHMFHALGRECPLSTSILEDWDTLRRTATPRSNTPACWVSAAKCMPLEPSEITKLLASARNERFKDALKLTLSALAADVKDPASVTAPHGDADDDSEPADSLQSSGSAPEENDVDDGADEDEAGRRGQAPAQEAIARYVLARATGTRRDKAAQLCGIAITLARNIDLEMDRR